VEFTIGKVIGWVVSGILAGSVAGMLVKRRREGFGHLGNLTLGLIGGLIGGSLFEIFNISTGLENISVSLQDLVAAFVGALIFLTIVWAIKRRSQKEQ
jgi:uncharacterized membrane protein YeaQ/YmgE (transglycosylase-associated protein family)